MSETEVEWNLARCFYPNQKSLYFYTGVLPRVFFVVKTFTLPRWLDQRETYLNLIEREDENGIGHR